MARANIHIRKDNEAAWAAIPDKSNWINTLLAGSDDTSEYGTVKSSPVGPVVQVLSERMSTAPCKHGADPAFCKHAKFIKGKKVCSG